jgi:hypothetical protein
MARDRAPIPLADRTTFVYRAFGVGGEFVYVGISQVWLHRLRGHTRASRWWGYVHHVEVQEFDTRAEAFAMESWAIAHETPLANTELQRRHCPSSPPMPVRSFCRRILHTSLSGDIEIPPREVSLAHSEYQTGVLAV